MHKVALVWSSSRNIFQPIGHAASVEGYVTTKKHFYDFSEALYNLRWPLGCQLPNFPTKDSPLSDHNTIKPNPQDSPVKVGGNHYYKNLFLNKKHFLLT